jgi:hypothetical protein
VASGIREGYCGWVKGKTTLIIGVAGVGRMFFSSFEESETGAGFAEGEPNPNLQRVTVTLGRTLGWLMIERDRQESEGLEEITIGISHFWKMVGHPVAIGVPFWIFGRGLTQWT